MNGDGVYGQTNSSARKANSDRATTGAVGTATTTRLGSAGACIQGRHVHRGTRREAVVDQDHRPLGDGRPWPAPAVDRLASRQFPPLPFDHRVQRRGRDALRAHQRIVEHHVLAADRPQRQFLVSGQPELAHHRDVQLGVQTRGYLSRDGHAAPGQADHQEIRLGSVVEEAVEDRAAGRRAIPVVRPIHQ